MITKQEKTGASKSFKRIRFCAQSGKLAYSAKSTMTMAAMASTITGVRKAKHTSWRPGMPALAMLAVGLNATRNTTGLPLVMPPFTPPA